MLSDLFSERVLRQPPATASELQTIILREAETPGTPGEALGTRPRPNLWSDEKSRFAEASFVTRSSFLLTNTFRTEIRADIRLPLGAKASFISTEQLENFHLYFPKTDEYFAISQAGFNFSKTEAILYANHFCAGLCGGGEYILLRKVNGVWRIVGQHHTWMS
ncbi:MAG: hypothetical protein JWO13_1796 [Acidobacteriales bacterium]|nr:hypothetical protein [Terriglobales bacterium]